MDQERKEQIRRSLDSQFDGYDGPLMSMYAGELLAEVERLEQENAELRAEVNRLDNELIETVNRE
jgi:cell division protein FtsB